MKTNLLATYRVVMLHVATLALCLLLFPIIAYSKGTDTGELQKSNLSTPQDFIEYASINDLEPSDSLSTTDRAESMISVRPDSFSAEDNPVNASPMIGDLSDQFEENSE